MHKIFVVEDHAVMRELLREYLERESDLTLCGEAATAEQALAALEGEVLPDLVLIDVSLPGMSGIDLARTLRARHPEVTLMMLSGHGEARYAEQALEAGAHGYMLKGRTDDLPDAIRQVLSGERYVSAQIRGVH